MSSENYVYKKEVDWSLFNYGFAIPLEYQVIFKQIAGRFLERGESKPIKLYLNGKTYAAKLQNNRIDSKFGNRADIVQVRYSRNSEIANALRGTFQRSYLYMQKIKQMQEKGSKNRIILPEEYKEYIAVYTTEYDDSYLIETIASEDVSVMRDAV